MAKGEDRECCPKLDRKDWDKKLHTWKDKVFYTAHYKTIFYVPIGFGKVIMRTIKLLKDTDMFVTPPMMVCRNETMWGGDLCIKVKKEDSQLPTEKISGKFFSMYFEGEYKNVGKWRKQLQDQCTEKNYEVKEILSHYATCPICAKKYGVTQTVLFARIA